MPWTWHMSSYDKLALRLFNFKSKALEAEVLGSRHNSGEQRPQMHKISVHGTDNKKQDGDWEEVCTGLSTSCGLDSIGRCSV